MLCAIAFKQPLFCSGDVLVLALIWSLKCSATSSEVELDPKLVDIFFFQMARMKKEGHWPINALSLFRY
jgi:hypothetical protein